MAARPGTYRMRRRRRRRGPVSQLARRRRGPRCATPGGRRRGERGALRFPRRRRHAVRGVRRDDAAARVGGRPESLRAALSSDETESATSSAGHRTATATPTPSSPPEAPVSQEHHGLAGAVLARRHGEPLGALRGPLDAVHVAHPEVPGLAVTQDDDDDGAGAADNDEEEVGQVAVQRAALFAIHQAVA